MASSKNNHSDLNAQLSRVKLDGLSMSKLLSPTSLVGYTQANAKPLNIGSSGDSKALSMSGKDVQTGINFGKPSGTKTSASNSGSAWTTLLKQAASGGIASALSGELGGIGGIGSVVSGILSLFGGGSKSTPPPLVEFQLPASEQQTVYVSSKASTVYQGNAVESANSPASAGGIYNGTSGASTSPSNVQALQYRSGEIAQAVKNALLNSSSLNDVIADI